MKEIHLSVKTSTNIDRKSVDVYLDYLQEAIVDAAREFKEANGFYDKDSTNELIQTIVISIK